MFNKNSAIVQLWVRLLVQGVYTMDKVPELGNLRDAVHDALHEKAENQAP